MEISQWKMFFVMLTEKEINQRELRDSPQTFRKAKYYSEGVLVT